MSNTLQVEQPKYQRQTKFLFLRLGEICREYKLTLSTNYYGSSDMHLVKITSNPKNLNKGDKMLKMKQTGESLNFCLNSIYERIIEDLGIDFNTIDN